MTASFVVAIFAVIILASLLPHRVVWPLTASLAGSPTQDRHRNC